MELLKWSWGLLVPLFVWTHKRLDKLSNEAIRREEFNEAINSLRDDIRSSTSQLTSRIDDLLTLMVDKK